MEGDGRRRGGGIPIGRQVILNEGEHGCCYYY